MRQRYFNPESFPAPRLLRRYKTHYLDGKLLKKPLWWDAVSAHPPLYRPTAIPQHDATRFATLLQRYSIQGGPSSTSSTSCTTSELDTYRQPLNQHRKQQQDAADRLSQVSTYCRNLATYKWERYRSKPHGARWRYAVQEAEKVFPFPAEITYPEDPWRERFLRDHPMERLRPFVLKEEDSGETVPLDAKKLVEAVEGGSIAVVDGEAVVQYTRALVEERKLKEEEAYAKACQAFYQACGKAFQKEQQERQKLQKKLAAERAKELGASLDVEGASVESEESSTSTSATTAASAATADDVPASMAEWQRKEDEAILRGIQQKLELEQLRRERETSRRLSAAM